MKITCLLLVAVAQRFAGSTLDQGHRESADRFTIQNCDNRSKIGDIIDGPRERRSLKYQYCHQANTAQPDLWSLAGWNSDKVSNSARLPSSIAGNIFETEVRRRRVT
jgi:hypothetical protein